MARSLPITLLLAVALTTAVHAQGRLVPLGLDPSGYPEIAFRFFLYDAEGNPDRDLIPEDFVVTESDGEREILSLICPSFESPQRLSSVLAVDVSGSMSDGGNIGIARAAARAWIEELPLGFSECAVTSFDDRGYVDRDFTIDRRQLLDAIDRLAPQKGTAYDAALIDDPAGAIDVATAGKHKRIVVLLTDGLSDGSEEEIVQAALRNDVAIYVVVLRMGAPPILRSVAERTGGLWFEGVGSADEAVDIYRSIMRVASGEEPCTLVWRSEQGCEQNGSATVAIPARGVAYDVRYQLPADVLPGLTFVPSGLFFGEIPPGSSDDRTVRVTASGAAVTITGISPTDGRFVVTSGPDLPIRLLPGDAIDLDVRFTPTDSAFRFGRIEIASDACTGRSIFLSGGWSGIRAAESTLRLVQPNGGERFPVGGAVEIEWEGVMPEDTVVLEYSVDGGEAWTRITENATGLGHTWSAPPTPSDRCLMRVRQRTSDGSSGVLVIPDRIDRLHAVDISPDGLLVATGGRDTITLYGSYDGTVADRIEAGGRGVNSLEFDPRMRYLAIGTGDLDSYLYDLAARRLQPITSYGQILSVVSFSPTGDTIIAHSYYEDLVMSYSATRDTVRIMPGHAFRGFTAHFSPDGSRIVSGSQGGELIVWNASDGSIAYQLDLGRVWVNSARFSPDGREIVVGLSDSTVAFYDAPTGALLRSFREGFVPNCVRFSPDGSGLLVAGYDPTVNIRDPATGGLLRRLIGHSRSAAAADWSDDGRRVATASWDSTVRVWDLTRLPYQEDSSDAFWSIVAPRLAGKDVAFGKVRIGEYRDSVVAALLCNTGTMPIRIDSISFADGNEFALVSAPIPAVLAEGECVPVEFRFVPKGIGNREDTFIVHSGGASWSFAISGAGAEPYLSVHAQPIDFGKVAVGSFRDSLVEALVVNVSNQAVWISDIAIAGPDAEQFSIVGSKGGEMLDPGDSYSTTLRFAPARKGKTSGSVFCEVEGGPGGVVIPLFGEGICPDSGRAVLRTVAEIEARSGEIVEVPILVEGLDGGTLPAGDYTIIVRHDRTLLAPLDPVDLDMRDGNDRVLMIRGRSSGDSLPRLRFIAALGADSTTPIVIESVIWSDGCNDASDSLASRFRLLDLCEDGGTRLFLDGDTLFLGAGKPNPASGRVTIEYGLLEQGNADLLLYDANGNLVTVLRSGESAPGRASIEVDVSTLASGTYYVLLKTPTQAISRQIRIVR